MCDKLNPRLVVDQWMLMSDKSSIYRRPCVNGRSARNKGAGSARRFNKLKDPRPEMALLLEPYARFDTDISRFCCRLCGYQAERYPGIEAHLVMEHHVA